MSSGTDLIENGHPIKLAYVCTVLLILCSLNAVYYLLLPSSFSRDLS